MIGFSLTEEQLVFRQGARDFALNQMEPYAAELDQGEETSFDWSFVRRFAEANLLGLPIPEQYGGPGADYLTAALVSEELGAGCAGMTVVAGTTWLAVISIMLVGSAEQKRFLPRVCQPGGRLAALASTETEAGSDVASMKTLAVKRGSSYVLNGRKHYITNAGLADFYVVFATTNPSKRHAGINAFIVEGDAKGLSIGRIEDKMGLRASRNAELVLENVTSSVGKAPAFWSSCRRSIPRGRAWAPFRSASRAPLSKRRSRTRVSASSTAGRSSRTRAYPSCSLTWRRR
jgi:butyryl-CoA dehydrogenase